MDKITVHTVVNAPLQKVWDYWTGVEHIEGWAFASNDWGAKGVENNLVVGGTFLSTMFAKDGSFSFDFEGTYLVVEPLKNLTYTLGDGRKVAIQFNETEAGVGIVESFDPESENSIEMQQAGWQAYLDNFKTYVEGK